MSGEAAMSLVCSSAFLAPNIELRETWEAMYTTSQKIEIIKFLMLLKEVSYTYQGCVYVIKNTIKKEYCEILFSMKKKQLIIL